MRLTDGVPLDPEIRPLCEALAAAGCDTVYSCGAHLAAHRPTARAYVTFATLDAGWVGALRACLMAPPVSLAAVRRDLHFDCLLGRYTLSLWPPAAADARAILDAALAELTGWIHAQAPARVAGAKWCTVPHGRLPPAVPCQLTLGEPPTRCGWTGTPLPATS